MKVVDEKGKLFGKLNVIDLLVIVVMIAVLVIVGIKWFGADSSDSSAPGYTSQSAVLTYTVRVMAQSEKVAEFVERYVDTASEKRDQLFTSDGLVDAYVVDFWTEPSRYNQLTTGAVEVLDEEAAKAAGVVDFCFVIEASVENTQKNLVGAQEVRVGKWHNVKTVHFEFTNGMIEDCVWKPAE